MEQIFPIDLPPGAAAPHLEHALAETIPAIYIAECKEQASEHVASGAYLAAFSAEGAIVYPDGSPDAVAVVNSSAHAEIVEYGHAGFHLPSRWTMWKISKEGHRYARVKFRHGTPEGEPGGGLSTTRERNQMPASIYAQAKRLGPGQALHNTDYRRSVHYMYYRRIGVSLPDELEQLLKHSPTPNAYTWKASPFAGMRKIGAPGHHSYLTIRTITPYSTGWYIPPQAGKHLMEHALAACAADIQAAIDTAVALDLAELALAATGELA